MKTSNVGLPNIETCLDARSMKNRSCEYLIVRVQNLRQYRWQHLLVEDGAPWMIYSVYN